MAQGLVWKDHRTRLFRRIFIQTPKFVRRCDKIGLLLLAGRTKKREPQMQVVILAGGRGTRAYPYTEYLPKPMMPVGGKPILARVMEIYARQGHLDFIISVGYRKEIILDYFENRQNDWNVTIVDSGDETDTGGRILACRHLLKDRFFATYSDGICDVNLAHLQAFHQAHDGLVTITSVPLVSQYGTIEADESGRIRAFKEKPVLRDYWINAGFFIMDSAVFDHWEGDNLEREVMPALQKRDLLYTYRHNGFFKSMDTHKDQQELERIYEGGNLPWLVPSAA
jgi:glucose-1-phosphate cytidylyltransferase